MKYSILLGLLVSNTQVIARAIVPNSDIILDTRAEDHNLTTRDSLPKKCSYSGPFKDGEGTYSTSDSDQWLNINGGKVHCWADYFAVDVSSYYTDWQPASGEIYCTDTQNCEHAVGTQTQYCDSKTHEWGVDVTTSLGASFAKIWKAEISVTVKNSWSSTQQTCVTASDTDTCRWEDKDCHRIWTRQETVRTKGYRRQRCTVGDVDQTFCMEDFEWNTPMHGPSGGCGSKCSDKPAGGLQ